MVFFLWVLWMFITVISNCGSCDINYKIIALKEVLITDTTIHFETIKEDTVSIKNVQFVLTFNKKKLSLGPDFLSSNEVFATPSCWDYTHWETDSIKVFRVINDMEINYSKFFNISQSRYQGFMQLTDSLNLDEVLPNREKDNSNVYFRPRSLALNQTYQFRFKFYQKNATTMDGESRTIYITD